MIRSIIMINYWLFCVSVIYHINGTLLIDVISPWVKTIFVG